MMTKTITRIDGQNYKLNTIYCIQWWRSFT